jgi:hypothetical protein
MGQWFWSNVTVKVMARQRERFGLSLLCLAIVLTTSMSGGTAAEALETLDSAAWRNLISAPWHGSYVCNQGLTRLRLTLHPLSGSGADRFEAEFAFTPDADNPSVPAGSFRMTGSLDRKSGRLVLKQDRWTEQPVDPSYRMIDLEGLLKVDGGQAMIRGKVTSYGCQDFAVWQFFVWSPGGR